MNVKFRMQQQNNVVISTEPRGECLPAGKAGRNLFHVLKARVCHIMVKRSLDFAAPRGQATAKSGLATTAATLGMTFVVLSTLFFVAPPAHAEQTDRFVVGSTCFRKDECTSPTYQGLLGPSKDPFCTNYSELHSQGAIERGFIYSCYSAPKPYKLQVPFLVPGFFGTADSLEKYLEQIYKFLIAIAGVMAGLMIIYAGVKWLTSAGNPEGIADAKTKIAGALVGLVLVLSSYLILNTINPDLVRLRLPPVKLIRQVGEVKETKCRKLAQFPCGGKHTEPLYSVQQQPPPQFFQPDTPDTGAYRCDKYPELNPCGADEASDCLGQYCERGDCIDIDQDRITPKADDVLKGLQGYKTAISKKRMCTNQNFCQGCNISITIEPGPPRRLSLEADRQVHLCASQACDCVVIARHEVEGPVWNSGDALLQCIKRKGNGENCNDDVECADGLLCNQGRSVTGALARGECQSPGGGGSLCARDKECAEGFFCTVAPAPVAGQAVGANQLFNQCIQRYSKNPGELCTSDQECKSRSCDLSVTSQIVSTLVGIVIDLGQTPVGCCRPPLNVNLHEDAFAQWINNKCVY